MSNFNTVDCTDAYTSTHPAVYISGTRIATCFYETTHNGTVIATYSMTCDSTSFTVSNYNTMDCSGMPTNVTRIPFGASATLNTDDEYMNFNCYQYQCTASTELPLPFGVPYTVFQAYSTYTAAASATIAPVVASAASAASTDEGTCSNSAVFQAFIQNDCIVKDEDSSSQYNFPYYAGFDNDVTCQGRPKFNISYNTGCVLQYSVNTIKNVSATATAAATSTSTPASADAAASSFMVNLHDGEKISPSSAAVSASASYKAMDILSLLSIPTPMMHEVQSRLHLQPKQRDDVSLQGNDQYYDDDLVPYQGYSYTLEVGSYLGEFDISTSSLSLSTGAVAGIIIGSVFAVTILVGILLASGLVGTKPMALTGYGGAASGSSALEMSHSANNPINKA